MPAPKRTTPDADSWSSTGYDKGRKTRRRIVDAASRLYAQQGYMATSIDQIGAATGLTKGAVYGHFKQKRALYLACMDDALSFFRETVPLDPRLKPEEALLQYLRWLGQKFSRKAITRALFIQLLRDDDDKATQALVLDLMAAPFQQLRGLIAALNPRIDATAAAFLVVSGLLLDADMQRYYVLMAGSDAAHDTDATVSRLLSMLKHTR